MFKKIAYFLGFRWSVKDYKDLTWQEARDAGHPAWRHKRALEIERQKQDEDKLKNSTG